MASVSAWQPNCNASAGREIYFHFQNQSATDLSALARAHARGARSSSRVAIIPPVQERNARCLRGCNSRKVAPPIPFKARLQELPVGKIKEIGRASCRERV